MTDPGRVRPEPTWETRTYRAEAEEQIATLKARIEDLEKALERCAANARTNEDSFARQLQYDGDKIRDLEKALREIEENALFAALHEYRRCSENQARGIISAYLAALSPESETQ